MHKSIVLCDDLSTDYLREMNGFILEWESKSKTVEVNTSGSTGIPKRVKLSKEAMRKSALATGEFFNFKKNQTLLINLSPQYIAGKLMLVRGLVHEMKMIIAPIKENPLLDLSIDKAEIDFAAFVPYQLRAILKDEKTRKIYQKINNVIIGGAPISNELENQITTLSNTTFATFGMTETITHFALRNCSKKELHYNCLPGITVSKNENNCLIVNENPIFKRQETTDIVELLSNTTFVWKGRLDNVINSGGIKLIPEILEEKIESILPKNRFYFKGRNSEKLGEELVLYIEGEKPSNWQTIQSEIESKLDKYSRPKVIIFVPKLEETATGKILRKNYLMVAR